MRLPELYALTENRTCAGKEECHYCGAPCDQSETHKERLPEIGVKREAIVFRPGSPYMCQGCLYFRRKRVTVRFPDGTFKDGQSPVNYGWFVTRTEAIAIVPGKPCPALYVSLLHAQTPFALAILDAGRVCHPQLTTVNTVEKVAADQPLAFTVNGIMHSYCVAELEHALQNGTEGGVEPGVRELVNRLGPYKLPAKAAVPAMILSEKLREDAAAPAMRGPMRRGKR